MDQPLQGARIGLQPRLNSDRQVQFVVWRNSARGALERRGDLLLSHVGTIRRMLRFACFAGFEIPGRESATLSLLVPAGSPCLIRWLVAHAGLRGAAKPLPGIRGTAKLLLSIWLDLVYVHGPKHFL